MLPATIQRQLNRLRGRLRTLDLLRLVCMWVAGFGLVLAGACFVDWLIDRYRDLPRGVDTILYACVSLAFGFGLGFVLVRLFKKMTDTQAALWLEDKRPQLHHRLISAVQFHQPGADVRGMSPDLLAAVTKQAEDQVQTIKVSDVVDPSPLRRASLWLVPVALSLAAMLIFAPETLSALLARRFFMDADIPRSVKVTASDQGVWPAGEENELRILATGDVPDEDTTGVVRIDHKDGTRTTHDLIRTEYEEDGAIVYKAIIPPGDGDFTFHARLADGRTRTPGTVHYEPRPIITRLEAFVQLPLSLGVRKGNQPYEEPQKGGDIVHRIAGCKGRIAITAQKELQEAVAIVRGEEPRSLPLTIKGNTAEVVFDLKSGDRSYEIAIKDRYRLSATEQPRRSIRKAPLAPPGVVLLPETFWKEKDAGTPEDREVEGIPILAKERFALAYRASCPYGLSHVRLRYKLIRRANTKDGDQGILDPDTFTPLPLGPARGEKKPDKQALREFSTLPVTDTDTLPDQDGGGTYDFDSLSVSDGEGGTVALSEGDRIQFYVEVFSKADPDGIPGRSAIREKEVLEFKQWWAWLQQKDDLKERTRLLEEQQRGLLARKPTTPPTRPTPGGTGTEVIPLVKTDGELGRSWLLLGPFANEKGAGRAKAYPPESGKIDAKEHDGIKGKIRWKEHHSTTDKIDLEKVFDHDEAGVAYALCWINAPAGKAILSTGSDDGIKVWIDKKLVLDKAVTREAIPDDDQTEIELKPGWHEVLVKIDNKDDSWAFYLNLLDTKTKKALPNVFVRLTPPEKKEDPRVALESGFVMVWQLLGPFDNKDNNGHAKVGEVEKDKVIDFRKIHDGRDGKIKWRTVREVTGAFNLLQQLKTANEKGVAYAVCWVYSPKAQKSILAASNSDGIKVWLDRKLVHDQPAGREMDKPDKKTIDLKQGWTELLVKIDNKGGRWFFGVRLLDTDGKKGLAGLTYRLIAPPKK